MRTAFDGHVPRHAICKQCHVPFIFQACHQRTQKFCGKACYFTFRRAHKVPLPCRYCGAPIDRKTRRVLCNKCWTKAPRKPRFLASCEVCGTKVERNGYRKGLARFCSYSCKSVSQERRMSHTCLHCGQVRIGPPHKLKRRRYCSPECVAKSRKETLPEQRVREALERMAYVFIPQHRVGRYTIDFYLPLLNVAVEVDGDYWHNEIKDSKKETALSRFDIRVIRLRFSDSQKFIRSNVDAVLRKLLKAK